MYIWLAIASLIPLTAVAQDHPTQYNWGTVNIEIGEEKTLYLDDEFSYVLDMPSCWNIWSSENSDYVQVTSYKNGYCTIKGVSLTSSPVKIKCEISYKSSIEQSNWSTWHGYYMVNVISPKPNSITIIDKLAMRLNEKYKFSYTLYPENAVTAVTWSSDCQDIISIDETGLAEAHALGTANVTVKTANGKSATCKVDVVEGNYLKGSFKQVSAGGMKGSGEFPSHSMILDTDGFLWVCGDNRYGQLGDGTNTSKKFPVKIMDNVKYVSAGGGHSMILKKDGTLWACGNNSYGQLGDGTTVDRSTPVKIMDMVAYVSAGRFHTMIVKTDGTLLTCGLNNYGELGDGTNTDKSTPVIVMNDVASVSAGDYHSMILKKDGSLWTCGSEFTLIETVRDINRPVKVMDNVASISAGRYHTMIVKTDGTLWASGVNNVGQVGDGTTMIRRSPVKIADNVVSVSVCWLHSMILKKDGSLWACGKNSYGELGDGTTKDRSTPVIVMNDVTSVSAGLYHTMILKTDGTIWACGNNEYGQFGDDTTTDRVFPIKISEPEESVAPADIRFVSVTCGNNNVDALTNNEKLVFHATFKNLGGKDTIASCVMITDRDLTRIIAQSDYKLRLFNTNEEVSIDYEYALDTIPAGNYVATIVFYDKNKKSWVYSSKYITNITIVDSTTSLQGDVNLDGSVNGTDLVALSNIILGRKEKMETADVNKDGSVNGTDIVALSNIILGRNNKLPRRTPEMGASLSIEPFDIKAGETKEMLIDLTNPNDEVTLVQFDLHLPAGLSIKKSGSDLDFDMAGRTSWRKHTLDANEINGAYRFLLYSSGNTLIEGTSGAIIKVNIVADESFNGGKIVLDNILLVDPNEKETKPEAYEYVIPTPDDGSAKLSIEPFDIAVGETKEMLIDLSNPNDEVTLVQFDLHLPAGLSIKKSGSDLDFDMAGRTSWRKHTLDANEVDGAYRFLLYSSGNTLIEGTSGAIIKVNLVADESFNGGKIVLDNILLVDPNEKETKPANYEYVIGSGSGISTVMMDASGENTRIYNLSGQKLAAPQKGINIIGGKKVVVK